MVSWAVADEPEPVPPVSPRVTVEEIEQAVADGRREFRTLVGDGQLVQSLYFGWFDRPYRRATLACAVKSLAVLDYELKLRRLNNGAMSDGQLGGLVDWLAQFNERAAQEPRRQGFEPNHVRVEPRALAAPGRMRPAGGAGTLFGFVDRATTSHSDDWSGDFDLLACLGFRVVGVTPRPGADAVEWRRLLARAHALGIAVTVQEGDAGRYGNQADGFDPSDLGPADSADVPLQPVLVAGRRLAGLIACDGAPAGDEAGRPGSVLAVVDPIRGETWAESLGRRALYRGATGAGRSVVTGWSVPRGFGSSAGDEPGGLKFAAQVTPEQVAAAMWVHALDGQGLALIEGWRDLRDGSASPYASATVDPATVEGIAHTALDLLRFGDVLAAFDVPRRVAVVIGEDAADCTDPADANRWSRDWAALFAALAERQIRFDVVPRGRLASVADHGQYLVVVTPQDLALAGAAADAVSRMQAGGATRVAWAPGRAGVEAVTVVVERRLSGSAAAADEPAVAGPEGSRPGSLGLLVFHGTGGAVAVANTTGEARTVWITTSGGKQSRPLTDAVTSEFFSRPDQGIECGPWQVRVLMAER